MTKCALVLSMTLTISGSLSASQIASQKSNGEILEILAMAEAAAQLIDSPILTLRSEVLAGIAQCRLRLGAKESAIASVTSISEPSMRDEVIRGVVPVLASIDPQSALALTAHISDPSLRGLSEGCVAARQAASGDLGSALKTVSAMGQSSSRYGSTCAIATQLFRAGKLEAGLQILNDAAIIRETLADWRKTWLSSNEDPGKGVSDSDAKLMEILTGVPKSWQWSLKESEKRTIADLVFSPSFVCAQLRWLGSQKSVEVSQFYELADFEKFVAPLDLALGAGFLAIAGEKDSAESLLAALMRSLDSLPKEGKRHWLVKMALQFVEMGYGDGALAVLEKVSDNAFRQAGFSNVAILEATRGDVDKALALVAKIKDGRFKLMALGGIAEILARHKRLEAMATIRLAEDLLPGVRDDQIRATAIAGLTQAYIEMNDLKSAQSKLGELEKIKSFDKLLDPMRLVSTCLAAGDTEIARKLAADHVGVHGVYWRYLATHGDRDGAIRVARSTRQLMDKYESSCSFIREQCADEVNLVGFQEPLDWAKAFKNPISMAYGLLGVAEGLLSSRRLP